AIDAFVRVDDEHVFALVEAVHGAHVDAVHNFAANTALVDDEGQLSVLWQIAAVNSFMVSARPRGARSLVENGRTEDLRPLAESEHRGAGIQRPRGPCSAGCRTSLCRSACSPGKHRSADAHHSWLEWTALGAGRDGSQFALSRRTNPVQALFCPCSSVADLRFACPS